MRDFTMPRVALDDQEQMVVTGWLVDEGGDLGEGVPALEVETSKASMEVEAPQDGVLALRLRQPGDAVSPGDVIALVAERGETYSVAHLRQEYQESRAPRAPTVSAVQVAQRPPVAASAKSAVSPDPQVSHGFLVGRPPGAIRRANHSAAAVPVPAATNRPVPEKLSRHRLAVSRLMTSSAAIPQFCVQREVDAAAAVEVADRLRRLGVALTLTDVFCKAAALTLLRHPAVNSWLVGDRLQRHPGVSISLATQGPAGVVAPVIHDVDAMDWQQLAAQRKLVVDGARAGRLHPDHLAGGTFSISNVGPVGGDTVIPLLVPPQVAILGLGRIRRHVNDRQVLTAALVADHRALDGADAARFLATLAEMLADPDRLILAHVTPGAGDE